MRTVTADLYGIITKVNSLLSLLLAFKGEEEKKKKKKNTIVAHAQHLPLWLFHRVGSAEVAKDFTSAGDPRLPVRKP
ncbi:hypothetical protein TI39_contig283g00003 [Zymoseptoria brevis]|uniref:Uncharacterized protein n=1 Tax=Zymoseptoria brevis TaxID=1047168 RepID=A0A0F4GW56_9PEZI|nr:hypothetical protein TI39_contig283g00003 [Zymoseptoria brevis]